jgi:hypothetical protein
VDIRPHLYGASLKLVLYGSNVSLRLRYAGRNCRKYPYNSLRSNPLDLVNQRGILILKSIYLDIRGIVYQQGYGRCKELPRRR